VIRPQGPACDTGAVESQIADLTVAVSDGGARPAPGQSLSYTLTVRNLGPAVATGATLTDPFPATLTGVSWTCAATAGSSCPASGSGALNHTLTLAAGGTATYAINATVAPSAIRLVTHTASVMTPSVALFDPTPANNAATAVTLLNRELSFYAVTPCRLADTRNAAGPAGGPALASGNTRPFGVVNLCGIPPTAWAVSVNATVTGANAPGNLRLFAAGTPVPGTSTLNYGAGQTRANSAVVLLGTAGDVAVYCGQATGTSHVLIDVNGYFQ
jgi:uncharacterized repeat protein (TIGR01451 family)